MRPAWLVAASLAVASLAAAPEVRADDPPPRRAPPPPDGQKPAEGAKGDAPKKDEATLRIERARTLVKELEEAIARVKAAASVDAQLLQTLMLALEEARALAKAAKPEELTSDEKKAVVEDAKKAQGGADGAPKDPLDDWRARVMEKALADADLTEEESNKAKKIIGDWYKESMGNMGDSKKTSDLKRQRDDDLEKALGKKKAQKVINNLNAMGPGRR